MGGTTTGTAASSSSLESYALITLAEMKTFPGFANLATANESIVEALINAVTHEFEDYWGTYGVRRVVYDEQHTYRDILRDTPNASKIRLNRYPILAASGVSIVDPAGNSIASTDYWINSDFGEVNTTGGWQIPLDSNTFTTYWKCTYVPGWVNSTGDVPANIKTACKMQVAARYKRPDQNVTTKKVGDLSITYAQAKGDGEGLPAHIKSMISVWKMKAI